MLSEAALVLYERLLHSGGEPADEQHDAADAAASATDDELLSEPDLVVRASTGPRR